MYSEHEYERVLLKITGESFGGKSKPLAKKHLEFVAREIKSVRVEYPLLEIAIIVGGGNFIRGKDLKPYFYDKTVPDRMGMLCTVVNAMALQDRLENLDIDTRVLSSVEVKEICEPYIKRRALRHLEKERVIILAGGTGNPNFTTDTAAIEKALDLQADIVLKGTKVSGVYDRNPDEKDAKLLKKISFKEILQKDLKILDSSAVGLAREKKMKILVFNAFEKGNLLKAIEGKIGSTIS